MTRAFRSLLCVLALATAAVGPAAAADPAPPSLQGDQFLQNAAAYTYLDVLAESQSFRTEAGVTLMRQYSTTLDPWFKEVLYRRYALEPWGAATLNLFTGGLGSLFMRDTLGGIILETGMALSYTAWFVSLSVPQTRAWHLDTAGQAGAIVFGVAGVIWPFLTAGPWNAKLRRSLDLD